MFKVGDVVKVARACLGNPEGALALVVDVYDLTSLGFGKWQGTTLLFRNGAADGFEGGDLLTYGIDRVGHCRALAAYQFESMARLEADHRGGRFEEAWRPWV